MTTALFPRWRQVVSDLLADGLPDGHVIQRTKLASMLGIAEPVTARDAERYDLAMLQNVALIRRELLERHRIHLRADGRGGLVVTPPEDQTDVVMRDGQRDMARAVQRMASGLSYVRVEAISDAARARNSDALAKIAALAAMHGKIE